VFLLQVQAALKPRNRAEERRKERIYRFEIFATLEAYLSLIKWALPIFSCWPVSPALESSDTR